MLVVALLRLLGVHEGLHAPLVPLHLLVVLVVLPGLLQLAVLVGEDVEQQQLRHHVCALLDLEHAGKSLVAHLQAVLVRELQTDLGNRSKVSKWRGSYSRKSLTLLMSAFSCEKSMLAWSTMKGRSSPKNSVHFPLSWYLRKVMDLKMGEPDFSFYE